MNISTLIKILEKFNDDTEVLVLNRNGKISVVDDITKDFAGLLILGE